MLDSVRLRDIEGFSARFGHGGRQGGEFETAIHCPAVDSH